MSLEVLFVVIALFLTGVLVMDYGKSVTGDDLSIITGFLTALIALAMIFVIITAGVLEALA